ncbi:NAD(P)H-dependent flavin oxidoreductase [Armatimonas rosea]|uniref:NAD(P)H-dependent flavin oxidoreductase YrpB (Nitropropane dioxygenase family) n=1 Tax=Armatimonas rosea TaxID=685828 RepID=A0A7W9W895_ARMRO|nr:nitronate monooxygenase [Armatimonas rosea]MBB6052036.1 NAD(P)H-dependent flavin oxidoreductase YrpB (nitropropane dioxygenase family) [Armatimonas rosea]
MKNRFCEAWGMSVPVVQAPVGSASCPELVAAVSNAGGLGMLSGTWREPEALRLLIRQTQERTRRPFGVNLVLAWDMTERLEICLEEGVRLLSFFWGDPTRSLETVHRAGATALVTVGSADEARQAADAGADGIVAQGWEAGGHVWGQVTTLALVPRVVDAVPELPVLAAGGIADGRGIAAALALGAEAAWMGTRFLLTDEARVHPHYQRRLQEATEADTLHTERFSGGWPNAPHRVLNLPEHWERAGEIIAHYEDGEAIPRLSSNLPAPGVVGDIDAMCLYAGQSVGLTAERLPAAALVAQLGAETRAAARNLWELQGTIR